MTYVFQYMLAQALMLIGQRPLESVVETRAFLLSVDKVKQP